MLNDQFPFHTFQKVLHNFSYCGAVCYQPLISTAHKYPFLISLELIHKSESKQMLVNKHLLFKLTIVYISSLIPQKIKAKNSKNNPLIIFMKNPQV